MARTDKFERNQILAEVVQGWAREHGVTGDAYISGLTRALLENRNLAMWSSIDPLQMLPMPKSREQDTLFKTFRRVNMVRNALVFAPVAVTWLAVGKATSAFQTFVEKNTSATVNFLEFWQNGYDVLGSEWRISRVATADFLIVLIVIGLTLFSNYLGEIANNREEEVERNIAHERTELALAIKEYLFTKQTISRLTLNQGVSTAIDNLVTATENLQRPRRRSPAKKKPK
jgi:hypothetical protein